MKAINISEIEAFVAGDKTLIKEILHPNKGEEDLPYSLAFASIEPGNSSLPHVLEKSIEVYIVLHGEGETYLNEEMIAMKKGTVVKIPKGAKQYVKNTGKEKLGFLCIVSPPWSAEQEVIL